MTKNKMTAKDLELMLKNKNIKINSSFGGENKDVEKLPVNNQNSTKNNVILKSEDNKKTTIDLDFSRKVSRVNFNTGFIDDNNEKLNKIDEKPKKKSNYFNDICSAIKNSEIKVSVSDNEINILFYGGRVLSLNQVMAYLQKKPQPFEMMKYKKIWHEKMADVLNILKYEHKLDIKINTSVKIYLYRESGKLIDEDSISFTFKYVIDGLKYDADKNPYGILLDDNQLIVTQIKPFQVKSKNNIIGIRIIKSDKNKNVFNVEDFLNID